MEESSIPTNRLLESGSLKYQAKQKRLGPCKLNKIPQNFATQVVSRHKNYVQFEMELDGLLGGNPDLDLHCFSVC